MNVLALAAAVVLAQAPAAPDTPAERPTPEPAAVPAVPAPAAAPRASIPESAASDQAPLAPAMATTTARRRRAPALSPELASSTSTSTSTSMPTTTTTGRAPGPTRPLSEREEAERAARTFLDALARGDANGLAAASSDRFSFDGEVQSGRETIRRSWREVLALRSSAPAPAVGALEIFPAQDAASRFGKPPARLASLVRTGVLVAVADVGGRTVVLFVARENGRMAVLGMHD